MQPGLLLDHMEIPAFSLALRFVSTIYWAFSSGKVFQFCGLAATVAIHVNFIL